MLPYDREDWDFENDRWWKDGLNTRHARSRVQEHRKTGPQHHQARCTPCLYSRIRNPAPLQDSLRSCHKCKRRGKVGIMSASPRCCPRHEDPRFYSCRYGCPPQLDGGDATARRRTDAGLLWLGNRDDHLLLLHLDLGGLLVHLNTLDGAAELGKRVSASLELRGLGL